MSTLKNEKKNCGRIGFFFFYNNYNVQLYLFILNIKFKNWTLYLKRDIFLIFCIFYEYISKTNFTLRFTRVCYQSCKIVTWTQYFGKQFFFFIIKSHYCFKNWIYIVCIKNKKMNPLSLFVHKSYGICFAKFVFERMHNAYRSIIIIAGNTICEKHTDRLSGFFFFF